MSNTTLKDFCDFQKGYAFKSKDYTNKGTRIVRVSDLNDYNVSLDNCFYIGNNSNYKLYELSEDDVIITTVGSWDTNPLSVVGKVVRVQKEASDSLLNQNAVRLRTKNQRDQKFLFYLLKNESFKKYIISTARGSASQASITQESIKAYSFAILSERKREEITKILCDIDKKIEACVEEKLLLCEMVSCIYKSWFNDFNYPNATGELIFSSQLDRKIPIKWDVAPFERFLTPTTEKIGNTSAPIYSTTNKGIALRDEKFNKNLTKSQENNKKVVKDDLVFGLSREILNFGVFTDEIGSVSPAYQIFKIDQSIILPFMLELEMRNNMSQYMDILQLGSREGQGIRKDYLMNKYFLVPKMEVQEEFFKLYDVFQRKISKLKEENGVLAEIRDTLLPKLMSGELPVEVGGK